METGINTIQRNYKIYNFTTPPDKTKTTAQFEVNHHILLVISNNESMS